MTEFNNRIDAQRQILRLVNRRGWTQESLYGLSGRAIDRWISQNVLDPRSPLVDLVRSASAQLYFLANKSQEQVTDEYRLKSRQVEILTREIAAEIQSFIP